MSPPGASSGVDSMLTHDAPALVSPGRAGRQRPATIECTSGAMQQSYEYRFLRRSVMDPAGVALSL